MSGIIGAGAVRKSGVIGNFPSGHIIKITEGTESGSFGSNNTSTTHAEYMKVDVTKNSGTKIFLMYSCFITCNVTSNDFAGYDFSVNRDVTTGSDSDYDIVRTSDMSTQYEYMTGIYSNDFTSATVQITYPLSGAVLDADVTGSTAITYRFKVGKADHPSAQWTRLQDATNHRNNNLIQALEVM